MNEAMANFNGKASREAKNMAAESTACLERLQREARNCLDSFPSKVIELNTLMESYMPDSVKTSSEGIGLIDTRRQLPRSPSFPRTIRDDCELASIPEFDDRYDNCRVELASVTSYYSLATHDRSRTRHGISKRRYYRLRGLKGTTIRRRPGPLGQFLVFVASKLATCTRTMVIIPSWYIIDRIISIFFQRRQLKNAQCGPSLDRRDSMSSRVTNYARRDDSRIGNFIGMMRPTAVQLIADTTTLKRWLQAIALTTEPPSMELVNATRITETIDCWAYELFFHLKYLQVNRAQNIDTVAAHDDSPMSVDDQVSHINLWHRLVQLRDNYIILYETLYDESKIRETMPPK